MAILVAFQQMRRGDRHGGFSTAPGRLRLAPIAPLTGRPRLPPQVFDRSVEAQ